MKAKRPFFLYRCRNQECVQVGEVLRRLLLGQHPEQLRSRPVFRRQQGRCAHDVLQELDRQVLESQVGFEVLRWK